MVGWIQKQMNSWMDIKNIYEKIDGQLDGEKKIYEKIEGWLNGQENNYEKKWMDGWMDRKKRMVGWIETMDGWMD